ncbi:hypothetical protein PanWU01x14_119770, partial [Parasponia andersonii]
SIAKSKTPESTPPTTKGKEKVDTLKKQKVAFKDILANTPPLQSPLTASQPEPPKEMTNSDEGPSQVDKDEELFALLHQLSEKASMSAAFIDHFTSKDG